MRILVDECVPRQIVRFFQNDEIHTVPEMGWSGIKNGELIKLAEVQFDIFITSDRNLRYQQNLTDRKISIIELSTKDRDIILSSREKISHSVSTLNDKSYLEVVLP